MGRWGETTHNSEKVKVRISKNKKNERNEWKYKGRKKIDGKQGLLTQELLELKKKMNCLNSGWILLKRQMEIGEK